MTIKNLKRMIEKFPDDKEVVFSFYSRDTQKVYMANRHKVIIFYDSVDDKVEVATTDN